MRKALSEHACPIIVACDATDRCNDSQQSEPMAELMREAGRDRVASIANGTVGRHLIPAGMETRYFSDVAVAAMERDGFDWQNQKGVGSPSVPAVLYDQNRMCILFDVSDLYFI